MIDHDDAYFADAVTKKKFEEIERLFPRISKGAKRQYITGDGFNPLHYASSPEIVRFFISSGIDVNVKNLETDETPLLTVIKLGKSPSVVRELLNCGASIEARNKHTMNTPLIQATQIPECPLETIQALLEYGAVVNAANIYCDTPLHIACRFFQGDLKIIELLLKFGSPVNFKNLRGDAPLNVSLRNPFCTAVLLRRLIEFNAKVDVKTFQHAIEMQHNYLNIITELMQHASVTNVIRWEGILQHLLMHVGSEQKLMDLGKLIIKYSFLKCENPHQPLVETLLRFKEGTPFSRAFLRGLYFTGIIRETVRKQRSYLATITDNLKSFLDDCFSEIKHMKRDMLERNISVYDFIVSTTDKVFLDDKILKILKENAFPIYSDIILNKIKKAALVDKLILQQVYTIVQHGDVTRRIVLDAFSICNIAKYLGVDEIRNFVDAFCDPSKDEYCFWDNLREIEVHLSKRSQIRRAVTKKKPVSPTGHSSSKIQKKTSPRI